MRSAPVMLCVTAERAFPGVFHGKHCSVSDLDYLQSGMCLHPWGRSEWLRAVAVASPAEVALLLIHLLRANDMEEGLELREFKWYLMPLFSVETPHSADQGAVHGLQPPGPHRNHHLHSDDEISQAASDCQNPL